MHWGSQLQVSVAMGEESVDMAPKVYQLNHANSSFKEASKHVRMHIKPDAAAKGSAKGKAKSKAKASNRRN